MKVRKILCTVLVLAMVLTLLGCGKGAAMDSVVSNGFAAPEMEMSKDMLYDAEMPNMAPDSPAENVDPQNPAEQPRKWIVTVRMEAETDDLDVLLAQLDSKIAGMSGYVEDQQVYNGSAYSGRRYRYANLTVRVPADQVEAFTEHMSGISNIISKNKTMDDVTLQYVATESRMKALKAEEERLLELMAQAENMSDLLQIEARLTDVRYELESVTSQLRVYDNLVDYATIHLNLTEVQEYTPVEEETLWQRISGGFVESLKNLGNFFVELFVALIVGLPYLVFIGAIVVVVVILCRRSAKKRKQKLPQPPHYPYAPPQNPTENQ